MLYEVITLAGPAVSAACPGDESASGSDLNALYPAAATAADVLCCGPAGVATSTDASTSAAENPALFRDRKPRHTRRLVPIFPWPADGDVGTFRALNNGTVHSNH